MILHLERSWSQGQWSHWIGWWPLWAWWRSSGAGRGWCGSWERRGSPAPLNHSDSRRCTWSWSVPERVDTKKRLYLHRDTTWLTYSYSTGMLTWDWIYFSIELHSKVLPKPMRLKMCLKRMNPCAKQVCVPCISNLMHTNIGIRDMHRQITFWWERGWINRKIFTVLAEMFALYHCI